MEIQRVAAPFPRYRATDNNNCFDSRENWIEAAGIIKRLFIARSSRSVGHYAFNLSLIGESARRSSTGFSIFVDSKKGREGKQKKKKEKWFSGDEATKHNAKSTSIPDRIEYGKYEESFNLQFVASKTSLLAFHSTRSTRFRPKDILLRNACSNATRFTTIFLPRVTHRAIVFTTFHRPPSLSALSSTFARLCASQVLFPPRSTVFWHGERNVSSYRWEFVDRNGEERGGDVAPARRCEDEGERNIWSRNNKHSRLDSGEIKNINLKCIILARM